MLLILLMPNPVIHGSTGDDDNGRIRGGGGWSPNLGLAAASEASDANLGDQMTDTSQYIHKLLKRCGQPLILTINLF